MKDIYKNLGEVVYDGLISDLTPPVQVRGGTIRKGAAETAYARGSIMAKSSTDGKLVLLGTTAASGETLTPWGVLTDDETVGTAADEPVTVYTAGCFDLGKTAVATGYTITDADLTALRQFGIVFRDAQA